MDRKKMCGLESVRSCKATLINLVKALVDGSVQVEYRDAALIFVSERKAYEIWKSLREIGPP